MVTIGGGVLSSGPQPVVGDGLGIQDKNCTGGSSVQTILISNGSNNEYNEGKVEVSCADFERPGQNSYLTDYSTYLKNNLGIEVMQIRYPVSSDFISLGCTEGVDEGGNKMAKDCSKTGYTWLYSTNYFLGERFYLFDIWEYVTMMGNGHISLDVKGGAGSGHRPVIKIKKSLIV